jgi:phage gp29-like protein
METNRLGIPHAYHIDDRLAAKEAEARAMMEAQTTSRMPDVLGQVTEQENITRALLEYSQKLEERLSPVLRQAPEAVRDGTPAESLVPLANTIRDNNTAIASVVARINSILTRLEL